MRTEYTHGHGDDMLSTGDAHETHENMLGETFFQRLKTFDSDCWNVMMERYAPRLRQDIIQSLNKWNLPSEWADDVEQDTWVVVIRQIHQFMCSTEDEHKIYHWFRTIAAYQIRNLERSSRRASVSFDEIEKDSYEEGLSLDFFLYIHELVDDSPETRCLIQEHLEQVYHAMKGLKARDREILLRRLLYRENIQELALEYGVKPETISVIIVRAKQAILSQMDPRGF